MSKINTVLKVENLSKLYKLGEIGTGTISHDINRWWAQLRGKEDPYAVVGSVNDRTQKAEKGEKVWALKDINFEIKQGEVLGIIGKNGAGKSTLLKLLSRITAPTTGSVKIKGRVASLLEVGTGMHPEMTGRENVYLNGTILGMTKKEIDFKFEEIMDFAGCSKYVDTPVKRYSSGMKVRLAFAVAAFLEPEILIVDEVLAVGDAEFQKKAIGKMQDISQGKGRTVLFVSHNMASILNLCTTGMFLKNGKIEMKSSIEEVVDYYLHDNETFISSDLENRTDRKGSQRVFFTAVKYFNKNLNEAKSLISGENFFIQLNFKRKNPTEILRNVHFSIGINDNLGNRVFLLSTDLTQQTFKEIPAEVNKVYVEIPQLQLKAGSYSLTLNLMVNGEKTDWIPAAANLNVESGDFFNTGMILPEKQGSFLVKHSFTFSEDNFIEAKN